MDDRLPRYLKLRDEIAARIAALEWLPDQPLPTELDLSQAYGVAIGTVRKAIDVLEQEGHVERFQGRGTFIRRASFDQSLFRFFRFQRADGQRRPPQSRILARDVLPPPTAIAMSLKMSIEQIAAGAPTIRLSRLRIVGEQPLVREQIWLPHAPFSALADLPLPEFADLLYPMYEARCGQVVARASERLTIGEADEDDVEKLQLAPGAPVVVIERTAFAHDNRVLEWRVSRGAAAHFSYEIEIR
ncbi:GntR family transcriptional regulator [Robbsia sp. KACC 23696]|uniref:GntR family transcriptional regulator n=1 Tax=Robbsia sp. KACC 23696 TaxID=3149231 RepID=UPI00325AD2BB